MIRSYSLLFLFLSLIVTLPGQTSVYGDPISKPSDIRHLGLHTMPLSFVNSSPRLRLGGMYRTGRWGFVLDLEYGNKIFLNQRGADNAYQFYGLRPEVRLYDDRRAYTGALQRYLGMEFSYNRFARCYSYADGSPVLLDNVRYDRVTQKRQRSGLLLKFGLQKTTDWGIYFDVYTGVGAAVRTIEYVDGVNAVPDDTEDNLFIPSFNELDAGRKVVADLALGIRMGYLFSL